MPETPSFADVFDETPHEVDQPAAKLDPDEVFDELDTDTVGARVDPGDREPRFDGDTSELPAEVCWTLQELVAAPHISEKDRKHWPVLLQYEDAICSRLSELGLILEINREFRYAFTRQADDPSPHSRVILRAKKLSLSASALALFLYQRYLTSPDDPIVATGEMVDHMMAYKRPEDTDEKAFRDKINAAIAALDKAAIIKPIKSTADRYLIYGVITSILTADRVDALERRYRTIARGDQLPHAADDGTDETAENGDRQDV